MRKGLLQLVNTGSAGLSLRPEMFWLICLWLAHLFCLAMRAVCIIRNTPDHTRTSFSTLVFTPHWVENINWRQSVPRLRGLEEGLGSESWLSSQEVLFLTALHKHWKRDPKKMSQTHYFHCKQADIHILYCSLSRFLSYVSPLSLSLWQTAIYFPRGAHSMPECAIQKNQVLTYADQLPQLLNAGLLL